MPIFDQGYQHWQGTLSGHGWRWLAVARHGVRAVVQNRVVRLLLLLAWLPAIALVTFITLWGLLEQRAESVVSILKGILPPEVIENPLAFRSAIWTVAYSYFFKAELICSLFIVLVVGPNLVSRDLRFNALPLYLSRPVRRIDYFLGKLGVIGFFILATVTVPAVGAYLMGLAFSFDLGVVRETHQLLWASIFYGLLIAVSAGTLMLAMSSLSRRSIYVGLAWAGFVFLTQMLSTVLVGIRGDTERREIMQAGIRKWVQENPPPPGIELHNGAYPVFRNSNRWMNGPRPGEPPLTEEEQEKERWYRKYSGVQQRLFSEVEAARAADSSTDWRPLLSYSTNLDRLGEWLLDADSAWVMLGKALEPSRAMAGPVARSRGVPVPDGPVNDRRLADRMVWQFPWYWSAATLTGLWLLSVFILSFRVKSLDRLK